MASPTLSSLAFADDEVIDLNSIADLYDGVVQGAVFALAMPKLVRWNSALVIYAHGYRSEDTPLHAEVDDPFWWRLVQQGWAVGVTSYRRSGKVVGDAIKDINNLRNYVCNEFSPPFWVFVDGRSMGGAISTRIAELPNAKSLYSGVIAIGAALLVKDDDPKYKLKYRPTIPIVYLTNTSETGPIEDYIAKVKIEAEKDAKTGAIDEVKVPALHLVYREGHNWTNPRERWAAFSLLVDWVFTGSMVTKFVVDATKAGKAQPGLAALKVADDGSKSLEGKVNRLGNTPRVITSLHVKDLEILNIRLMSKFKIVNAEGKELEVTYGAYPFVGIGDECTVAAEDPEGYVLLFDVAEMRNLPSPSIPTMKFKFGDSVTFKAPVQVKPKRIVRTAIPLAKADENATV